MDSKILEVIKIIDSNPVLYKIFRSCPYEILHFWNRVNFIFQNH